MKFAIFVFMKQVQISKKYYLTDSGQLFNIKTGAEFIPCISRHGYRKIKIARKTRLIHQLVMENFGPPKPGKNYQIDHINRDKLDNRIENLRWVTPRENCNNRISSNPIGERSIDFPNAKAYSQYKNKKHIEKIGLDARRKYAREQYHRTKHK